ncbi:MAG: PKD domain-containing protein, partial [Bacteroidota bacterium]
MGVFYVSKATHIVGGEIVYKHIANDSFEIRLDLYIDCFNGNPGAIQIDSIAMLGIFDTAGTLIRSMVSPRGLPQRINSVNYNCVIPPTNACVDQYSYLYYTSLPKIPGGYIVSFQRCCRNNSINNIINPGSSGATYWASIPDTSHTAGYNSSARFNSLPPNFICNARDFIFDHSATDPDGDSISYKLYTPYIGADPFNNTPRPPASPPYSGVFWLPPYSEQEMMNGNPELAIDSVTGRLTVKPVNTGQFVVGIAAYEYRKGNLININRRDFQFNVLNCVFNTVSSIGKDIAVCNDTVRFINTSVGADTYLWTFGDSLTTKDTSTLKEPIYVYPGPGRYTVKLVVYKGNCSDSSFSKIEITQDTFRFAGRDTSICKGASVMIGTNDTAGFNYTWSPSLFLDDSLSGMPTST